MTTTTNQVKPMMTMDPVLVVTKAIQVVAEAPSRQVAAVTPALQVVVAVTEMS